MSTLNDMRHSHAWNSTCTSPSATTCEAIRKVEAAGHRTGSVDTRKDLPATQPEITTPQVAFSYVSVAIYASERPIAL